MQHLARYNAWLNEQLTLCLRDAAASRWTLPPPLTRALTLAQVLRAVVREEGVAGLYRGCTITCARAVPSHAAIFYLYEVASQQLSKY